MVQWDDATLRISARNNWITWLDVLSGCALDWRTQLERDDFDRLFFLFDAVQGVRWQFEDLGWLTKGMQRELTAFDAAIAVLTELGDAAYEDETLVRDAPEWAEVRGTAARCLRVLPPEPWTSSAG